MAILLADIGGTNARFRWLKNGKLGSLFDYKCEESKTPFEAINKALKDSKNKLNGIVLAGAGPVQKGALRWTNRPKWKISETELQKKYHIKKALVVNDVQAQGEGLKTLYKCEKTSILMTAGTGLGGCFIINGKVVPGEVGQMKLDEKLKVEDFVSGLAIVRLYHQYGGDKKITSARKIEELRKKEKAANQAYLTFYQTWGQVSAQLATALYAMGGIYLWGGLIPKAKDKILFMKTFEKMFPQCFPKIPVHIITDKNLAFKGLVSLSRREFGQS